MAHGIRRRKFRVYRWKTDLEKRSKIMVIVITQLHTTFMVLLAIVPFFMIPVFADVEVEGVSGFYGHDDAYNVIGW